MTVSRSVLRLRILLTVGADKPHDPSETGRGRAFELPSTTEAQI